MRRELGNAPFSKQAVQILRPIYKRNVAENKVKWSKVRTSMHDKYLAMRALETGHAHSSTHATHMYPPNRLAFADLVTAKLPLAQNAADVVALINAYKVPFVRIQVHITIP